MPDAAAVLDALRWHRVGVEPSSPLYHRLLGHVIDDVGRRGPCHDVLVRRGPDDSDLLSDAYGLRFLGGLHRLVLAGAAPELARWFPSAGGTVDAADGPLEQALLATVAANGDALVHAIRQPVQTNEVGRCAALLLGFLAVIEATGLPLRIFEIGASAGLNLRWDHYRYEGGAGGSSFGDPESPVRFADVYRDPRPDLGGRVRVIERRGCDRRPVAFDDEGVQTLRSFVWPDQPARLAHLDAAIEVARRVPAVIDRADAGDWVQQRLTEPAPGTATVVFHSIVWQYLPDETRNVILQTLHDRGAVASDRTPMAWLRFEPAPDPTQGAEVRLTRWPGGEERLLTRGGYHGRPVRAIAPTGE